MENIRKWFEEDYERYDIREYDGNLEAKTNILRYLIVSPHGGTKDRWMLRITTNSAFDRWANSTVIEEFFTSSIELRIYLYEHKSNVSIYKDLLEYLSMEYDELREEFEKELC